jgi:arylsulfatase A-like enzyme
VPTTPVLDAVSRRGVLFRTCIAQAPETLPSHRSIMTGTYPGRHRSTSFFGTLSRTDLPSIARVLSKEGYDTAAFTEGGGVSSH